MTRSGRTIGAGHGEVMESNATQKNVTNLPKLPYGLAWQLIEAHHDIGTNFWLRITDRAWNEIDRYGWRTGYVPTHGQLRGRAQAMMKAHNLDEAVEEVEEVQVRSQPEPKDWGEPDHEPCCSSHNVTMSCENYRRTHFVEVRPCCHLDAQRLEQEHKGA